MPFLRAIRALARLVFAEGFIYHRNRVAAVEPTPKINIRAAL
jgi:hypothetical protein